MLQEPYTSASLLFAQSIDSLGLLNDRRRPSDLLSEDLGLDEPREPDLQLIADKALRWDRENLCE